MSKQQSNRIVLRGHEYATPRTESVEIINQGVLCASTTWVNSNINSFTSGGSL